MSAELYSVNSNNSGPQGTTVGDSKPLHRFIKGQPKIAGIIVLILGSSFFIVSIGIMSDSGFNMWAVIQPGIFLGILVTISLALSVVTILSSCWVILNISVGIAHADIFRRYDFHEGFDENGTDFDEVPLESSGEIVGVATEAVYLFYSIVGTIIVTVMSSLAGAALRSTRSRTVIVMTTAASETPAE